MMNSTYQENESDDGDDEKRTRNVLNVLHELVHTSLFVISAALGNFFIDICVILWSIDSAAFEGFLVFIYLNLKFLSCEVFLELFGDLFGKLNFTKN